MGVATKERQRERRTTVLVNFKKVKGVTQSDLLVFITDALETWGGQRHPDDPLFHSLQDVQVSKPIALFKAED